MPKIWFQNQAILVKLFVSTTFTWCISITFTLGKMHWVLVPCCDSKSLLCARLVDCSCCKRCTQQTFWVERRNKEEQSANTCQLCALWLGVPKKGGFEEMEFKQIRGYLRKRPFSCVFWLFPNLWPLRKGQKSRKKGTKRKMPISRKAARHPLNPPLVHTPIYGGPSWHVGPSFVCQILPWVCWPAVSAPREVAEGPSQKVRGWWLPMPIKQPPCEHRKMGRMRFRRARLSNTETQWVFLQQENIHHMLRSFFRQKNG